MSFQAGGRGCFNCGEATHQLQLRWYAKPISPFKLGPDPNLILPDHRPGTCRECTVAPKEKSCYRCGTTGHISRECPQAAGEGYGGGAPGGQECYKCGRVGHIARNCPQGGSYGGGFGGGYGGRQQTCYSCGGFGHMARDCTHGQKCYNCGEVGHVSRDCPTEAKGERVCYNCKQPGHVQAACPN
ncbi:conserved hypothetical protein [Aspergillus terreus NIH2624]|uniref:CCHC-type domain-containing protein n=1 Tax=Aspergillus terreus (strain NIH 2624 / FGSC A1156) TaxID=341663 RepID=Q0C7W9_ASPTN|nr:uncharacterized protein ATEG_10215 [Aspergillus terreus NIH2624]EAU29664.1 conserved hypothetical protein [Aspergillus terreus NIH2624]